MSPPSMRIARNQIAYRYRMRGSRRLSPSRRLAQLSALQETSRALVGALELNALLELIVQQASALLHAEGGILNLVDWEAGVDEVVACAGKTAKFLGVRYSLEKSLSGWASLHNQAALTNQLDADPRVAPIYEEMLGGRLKNAAVAPLAVKDRVLGSLVLIDKSTAGAGFTPADIDLLVSFASLAASAIENARLFRAEKRRAEQFRVIGEVGRHIAAAFDVDDLLRQMASQVRAAFGYERVEIAWIEDGTVGAHAASGADRETSAPDDLWSAVVESGEPQLSSAGDLSRIAVPLKSQDAVTGVLSAECRRPQAFDESDAIVLGSLANQAAAAVENIRHYQHARELAVVEERSRLARELHDAVTQTIFSAGLLAEALPDAWERDRQAGREMAADVRRLCRAALAEMRSLLLELRPAALAETPLEDLLRQLGEAAGGREGLLVTVTVEGAGILPPDVHLALYRIAQEALNNLARHARAGQAGLRLCYRRLEEAGPFVRLAIQDDGCGFDPSQVAPDHLGLKIMRERAQAIGAALSIDSAPGRGATIVVQWQPQAA